MFLLLQGYDLSSVLELDASAPQCDQVGHTPPAALRQCFSAAKASSKASARPACREPAPLVWRVLVLTVAQGDSMGLVVRRRIQCSAGKSKKVKHVGRQDLAPETPPLASIVHSGRLNLNHSHTQSHLACPRFAVAHNQSMTSFVSFAAQLLNVLIHLTLQRRSDHAPRPLAGQLIQRLHDFRRCAIRSIWGILEHGVSFLRPPAGVLGLTTLRIRRPFCLVQSTTLDYIS